MTPKQKMVYDFVVNYWQEHEYAPSYANIRDGCGIKSTSEVYNIVSLLVKDGWLKKLKNRARTLMPTDLAPRDVGRRAPKMPQNTYKKALY